MLSREDGQELITSFNNGMTELANAFKALGSALADAISVTFSFSLRTTELFYHIAGKALFPMQDMYQDTGADDPPSFSKLHSELKSEGVGIYITTVFTSIIPAAVGFILSISLAPLIGNSIQSLIKGFVQIFNVPLVGLEKSKISHATFWRVDTGKDKRNVARQIYGLPGYILGTICALPIAALISIFRLAVNSGETFVRTLVWGINLALAKGNKIEAITDIVDDKRHPFQKYVIGGILGLIPGAIAGIIGAFVTSTFLTGMQTFTSLINFVLPSKNKVTAIYGISEDYRNKVVKFGGGFFGLIFGGVAGAIAAIVIAIARFSWQVLKDSILSIGLMTVRTLSLALEKDIDYTDTRSDGRKYGFGFIGTILGVVTGGIAGFFTSTFLTGMQTFTSLTNLVLPDKKKITSIYGISEDKRNKLVKFGGGVFGLIFGGVAGIIAGLIIAIARFSWQALKDSILSVGLMTVRTLSLVLEKNIDYTDTRSDGRKYGFGLIGVMLGVLTGGIAGFITSTFLTGMQTFTSLTNLALPDKMKITSIHGISEDKRNKFAKFGGGFFGLILGGAIGSIISLIFGGARALWYTTRHTVYSFRALSGSLGNGAFFRPWWSGLRGDQRKAHQKVAGALGYFAAALTIAPLAFTYFTAYRVGLAVLFAAGLLGGGPLCLLFKGLGRLRSNSFDKLKDIKPKHLEKFKNLYSSIGFAGSFKEGKTLRANGTGSENAYRFFGKCTRLNLSSSTEHLLNTILSDYLKCKKKDRKHFFDDAKNLRPAITATQNRYQPSWVSGPDAIQMTHDHIEKTADFIFDYMKNDQAKVPKLYSNQKPVSWGTTFWGKDKSKVKVAGPTMAPRLAV